MLYLLSIYIYIYHIILCCTIIIYYTNLYCIILFYAYMYWPLVVVAAMNLRLAPIVHISLMLGFQDDSGFLTMTGHKGGEGHSTRASSQPNKRRMYFGWYCITIWYTYNRLYPCRVSLCSLSLGIPNGNSWKYRQFGTHISRYLLLSAPSPCQLRAPHGQVLVLSERPHAKILWEAQGGLRESVGQLMRTHVLWTNIIPNQLDR